MLLIQKVYSQSERRTHGVVKKTKQKQKKQQARKRSTTI